MDDELIAADANDGYDLTINPNVICRNCLAENCQLKSLFRFNIIDGEIWPLHKVYQIVTNLPVSGKVFILKNTNEQTNRILLIWRCDFDFRSLRLIFSQRISVQNVNPHSSKRSYSSRKVPNRIVYWSESCVTMDFRLPTTASHCWHSKKRNAHKHSRSPTKLNWANAKSRLKTRKVYNLKWTRRTKRTKRMMKIGIWFVSRTTTTTMRRMTRLETLISLKSMILKLSNALTKTMRRHPKPAHMHTNPRAIVNIVVRR